jgi:hypothetical protein
MNKKQKKVIWIALIIFILMGLFPPWVSMCEIGSGIGDYSGVSVYRSSDYSFILSPPRKSAWIDLSRLIPQWLMLSVLTTWMVYIRNDQNLKAKKSTT